MLCNFNVSLGLTLGLNTLTLSHTRRMTSVEDVEGSQSQNPIIPEMIWLAITDGGKVNSIVSGQNDI